MYMMQMMQAMQRFLDTGSVKAPDSDIISMPDAAGGGVRGKQGK